MGPLVRWVGVGAVLGGVFCASALLRFSLLTDIFPGKPCLIWVSRVVLAGGAPGLAEQVVGRLGRPLSEEPEFWRAAPQSALDWGAAEFDSPPSQGPGSELGGAGGFELRSAYGHLRAAGMRL